MERATATLSPTLTDQQRDAVEPNGVSAALSAGAGCGKTRVLTERFLLHLAPGPHYLGLERMAAMTFTDRAAREMRERIRQRCHEMLLSCPAEEASHWHAVLRDLETARISTIHSFCAQLLRTHAVEAAIDPHFAMLEESPSATLLHETVEETIYARLADHDADAEELVLRYGLRRLRDLLATMVESCDPGSLERWRSVSGEELADHWRALWRERVFAGNVRRLVNGPRTQALLALLQAHRSSHPVMEERRHWLLERLPSLPDACLLEDHLELAAQHARVQGGGRAKVWPTPELYRQVKKGLDSLRPKLDALRRQSKDGDERALEAAAYSLRLLRLLEHVLHAYARRKREAAVLDFRDLLIRARDLLVQQPAVCRRLSDSLQLILVDEFQDTDPVQVEILRLLCADELRSGKLFIVGDYKQAIYRFRRADPRLFAELRKEIPAEGRKSITENFRSQPAILEFVNATFCGALGPEYEPLIPHLEQELPPPNVEFLWTLEDDPDAGAEERRRHEARQIARRIREMLEQEPPLVRCREEGGGARHPPPIPPFGKGGIGGGGRAEKGDVAILFRALSDVRFYEEALREEGLDYYLVGGWGFYAQQEIWDLLNLLRAVENPDDAVSLAGVLRSPFFSLRDETLYWLADERGDLARGLDDRRRWQPLGDDERRRVEYAFQVLRELREAKDRLSLAELVRRALDLTGFDAVLLAEFLGRRKLANLRKIREVTRQFDRAGLFTLSDFIGHLSDVVAQQPREEQAATHPEKSNVIRLMTIHQAKGLEFPIVFVADLARPQRFETSDALLHSELGPLAPLPTIAGRKGTHLGLEVCKAIEKVEDQRESLRLFYVACTRAAGYLVLSSSLTDFEKPESDWMELLAARFDLRIGRVKATLPDGYGAAEVRVYIRGEAAEPVADDRILQGAGAPAGLSSGAEGGSPAARASAGSSSHAAGRLPNWLRVVDKVEAALSQAAPLPAAVKPIPVSQLRRRRFSPSELSAAFAPDEHSDLPLFASRNRRRRRLAAAGADSPPYPSQAALVGSAVHDVLRHLDFPSALAAGPRVLWLEGLIEQCCDQLDPVGAILDTRKVLQLVDRFLETPLAHELAHAELCYRELEFLLGWPPQGWSGDLPTRYLQGALDCLFQDTQGNWRLIDYKTDSIRAKDVLEHAGHYRLQLAIYATAAQRLAGKPLASARIYFLEPGVAWELDLDNLERWTVEHVSAAMDELINRQGE